MARWIGIAAVVLALAVALGAFGAHGLKDRLAGFSTQAIYEKAAFYHFVHGIGMLIIPLLALNSVVETTSATRILFLFLAGVLLFSGSLYVLAITNMHWLGAVTPFGGTCFIIGWLYLAVASFRQSVTN